MNIRSLPSRELENKVKLLMENFDYVNYGILDEGHIMFFTEKTSKKLINDAIRNI